jgi:hypothetical protein
MPPPDPFNLPPANPGLKIAIFSELDGRTTELLFSEFPVRLGRNRQNDLVLRHEYVSQYHAEVHMVGGQLSIMQVGSSNSVRVDGRKLGPGEQLPITGSEEIRVVPFALTFQFMAAPAPAAVPMPPAPSPVQQAPAPPPVQQAPAPPPVLPAPIPSLAPPPMPAPASMRSDTVMPVDEPLLPNFSAPAAAPGAWEPPPAPPPQAAWDQGAPLPPPAGPGSDAGHEAYQALDRLARKYLGRSLVGGQEVVQVGAQLEQALDIFLRFFVAMQRGQVQFYEQMGLPPPADYLNPVEQSSSAAQLGGLLLNPGDAQAAGALEEAFESQKVHQVAVLRGMEAGVRSLLRRVSPRSVTKVASRLTRSPGVKTLWETYRQMHEDLAEEDQEAFKVIYGGQFRKAYLRLMQAGRQAMRG